MEKTYQEPAKKISPAPSGGGGGGGTSNGGAPATSSLELSWLAEKADGSRDEDLVLVKDKSGALQLREAPGPGKPPDLEDGDMMIVNVRTKACQREKVVAVNIQTESGAQPPITGKGPDALFWTESAVEKFLYPYYHSQRIWGPEMDALRAKFAQDSKAYAILHRAPSHSQSLSDQKTLEIARMVEVKGGEALQWVDLKEYVKDFLPKDRPEGTGHAATGHGPSSP